ncbi:hypothetical protein ACN3XK_49405 [Actinomadura welshii]
MTKDEQAPVDLRSATPRRSSPTGIVQTPLWRPDGPVTPDLDLIWVYGAVGRKL